MPLFKKKGKKIISEESYTDPIVVAAFNSCIDLVKYAELPHFVKARFAQLLKNHRLKAVCFMEEEGIGLRVFRDIGITNDDTRGDEVINESRGKINKMDLDGHWVRCPAKLYTDLTGTPIVVDKWIIANQTGDAFLSVTEESVGDASVYEGTTQYFNGTDDDEDEDEDTDDDTTELFWNSDRSKAYQFPKRPRAISVANKREVKGVVLQYKKIP